MESAGRAGTTGLLPRTLSFTSVPPTTMPRFCACTLTTAAPWVLNFRSIAPSLSQHASASGTCTGTCMARYHYRSLPSIPSILSIDTSITGTCKVLLCEGTRALVHTARVRQAKFQHWPLPAAHRWGFSHIVVNTKKKHWKFVNACECSLESWT